MSQKKPYKVLNPIAYGERRERGEIVYMSDEEARAFGDEYVASADEPVTTGEPEQSGKVESEEAVQPRKTRKARKK